MSAQDRTLQQYHEWMQINAVSHLIRAARQLGLFQELEQGQRTTEQLCEALSLRRDPVALLLDALVAIGIIEKYGEDHALSQAARLLCQYDDDLGDARWQTIVDRAAGRDVRDQQDDQVHFDHIAATQWIHTPAAMQAAEILDIGGEGETAGPSILDIGCGSAVWSCAMAHRDPESKLTLVDNARALAAAVRTADSIGLTDRLETIEGDPLQVPIPAGQFDIVLIAQRLHSLGPEPSELLLKRAVQAARPNAKVVVIDLFRGPSRPQLSESVEALKLELGTTAGRMRSLEETQQQLRQQGLQRVQFAFLAATPLNLGLAVGVKE